MRLAISVLLVGLFSQTTFAVGSRPDNFFQVDSQVMRGGALTEDNVRWLASQGVKTIIKLDDENPDEMTWEIPVENLHINKYGLNLTYPFVKEILEHIEDAASRGPVYVHCEKGADRTGLIIALYRITQGWTADQAWNEMNDPRFGHSSLQIWIDHKFRSYSKRLENERGS